MKWKYEKYTILKDSGDKRGLTILNAKPAKLSLDAIVSIFKPDSTNTCILYMKIKICLVILHTFWT